MHGNGTLTYPDGRVYEGGFKHGQHSGHGTLKDNGKIIKGKFLEGRLVLVWAGAFFNTFRACVAAHIPCLCLYLLLLTVRTLHTPKSTSILQAFLFHVG
jgi:hypothetical protein